MEMNEFRNQLKALLATLQKLPSSDKQAALELLHLSLNDEVQNSSHSEAEETVPGSLSKKNYTEGNDDNHSMFEETQPLHNNSQQVPSDHEVLLVAALDRENDKEHHPSTSNQVPIHCSQNDFQEKYSTEILHHFSNSRCLEDTVANITGNGSKLSCQKQMNDSSHEESQVVAQNLSVNTVSKEFEDSLSTDHIVQLPTLGSRKVLSTHKDLQERSASTIAKNIPRIQRSHQYGSNIPTVTKPKYDIHASIPGTVGDYEQQSSNMEKYDAVLEIGAEDKLPGSSHEIIPELTPLCPRYFGNASQGGTELGSLLQPPGQDKHMGSIEDSSNSQAFEGNDSLLTDDGQLRITDMKAQERCGRKMETNAKTSSIMFDEGSSSSFNLTNFSHIGTRDGLYTEDNQYFLPYLERENYEKGDFKLEKFSRKNHYESTCTENSQAIQYTNLKYSECCRGQREVPPLNDYESDKNPVDLSSASSIHCSKVSGSVFNMNDFSNFHKSRLKSLHGEDVMFSVELNSRKRKQSQSRNVVKKRIHARTGKKMIIQSDKSNKRLEGKDSSVIEKNFCEIVIDGSMLEKSFESSNATSNSTSSVDESINESRSTFENHHSHPAPNYDNQLQSNMDQLHLGVEECEEESYKIWESSSLPYPSSNTEQTVCEEVLPRNLQPVCCRTCRKELADISLFPVHQRQCDGHLACPHCHAKFVHKVTYTRHLEGHKRNVCSKCSQSYCSHKKLKAHMKSDHNYNLISKLYPCHKCSRKFLKRSSLYHHLKVHAVGSEVVCQKCGVICVDQESYELHMDDHLKSTKFRCHICTASFKRRQQYDDHLKYHKKNKCEICGQPFTTKRALVRHCRVEHQRLPQNITLDPEYKCDKCNKVFNRPSLLHQHLQLHNGVKLECSLCDKQFSHRRGLRKHMNSVVHEHMLQTNNMEKDHAYDAKQKLEFMCEYCGIKLPTRITLTKHCRLKHKVGVTWSCPHCDYKTIRNHTLKRHMELHQENRNFMCEICGNSFQALATLKDHHNFVHSEERNYKCSECNKKFKNNSSLARHLRIHSDDRPYQCHCGTSYKRLSHLKRHMSSAHNEILKSRAVKKLKCSEETETIGEKSFKVRSQLSHSEHSDGEDYEIVPVSGSTTSPAIPPEASVKDTSDILLQGQENIILMGENSNSGQGHLITVGDSQIIQLIPSTFYPQDNSFQTVSLVSTNELHGLPIPMSMSSSSCYGQGGNSGQVVIEPFCLPQSSDTMVMVPVSQEDHVHLGEADVMRTTLKNLETGTFAPGSILRAVKQDDVKQEMNQSQEGNSSRQVMVEPFSVPQCSEAMAMVSAPRDEHVNMGEPDVIRTLDNENLTSGTIVREETKHDRKQELRLHPSQNQNELDIASSLDSYDYSSAEPSSNLLPALPPARFITHNHPHVHAHTSTSQLSQDILQPSIICSDFVLPVDDNR
ncbi:hypothetical protein Pcinc_016115 [Petrolisthes cinctipes]|uniref:C2H2-type domain-containing protein n=1 Tax=Petrolisthes cinctipes TaxID=88211 RepID=A0AAE1FRW9_PETCI|nr:hypothetical protein Pcinc_016115 [Petrolisthes cinctipes]